MPDSQNPTQRPVDAELVPWSRLLQIGGYRGGADNFEAEAAS